MQITLNIPPVIIANMMISAVESGDPVTNWRKGGWCKGIYYKSREAELPESMQGAWYGDERIWSSKFKIEVIEHHEEDDTETRHIIDNNKMRRGLTIMARKFPHQFSQILRDDTDAPCADIFLQCCVFGEEKYA